MNLRALTSNRVVRLLKETFNDWMEDSALRLSAALAYYFDPVSGRARRDALQRTMSKTPPARPVATVSGLSTTSPIAAAR